MTKMSFFRLAIVSLLLLAAPSQAKRRTDAFTGLTPQGYVVQTAPASITRADFAGAKVAIVPSQNFLNYMKDMGRWFRPEKFRNLFGERPAEENMRFLVHATEPQLLTDRLVDKLTGLGATAFIANNLPDAKAQGATMYIVFDYYGRIRDLSGIGGFLPFSKEKTGWESSGGLHVLDGTLRRTLLVEATAMDEYRDSSMLPGVNEQALKWATIISGSQRRFLDDLLSKWDAGVR